MKPLQVDAAAPQTFAMPKSTDKATLMLLARTSGNVATAVAEMSVRAMLPEIQLHQNIAWGQALSKVFADVLPEATLGPLVVRCLEVVMASSMNLSVPRAHVSTSRGADGLVQIDLKLAACDAGVVLKNDSFGLDTTYKRAVPPAATYTATIHGIDLPAPTMLFSVTAPQLTVSQAPTRQTVKHDADGNITEILTSVMPEPVAA